MAPGKVELGMKPESEFACSTSWSSSQPEGAMLPKGSGTHCGGAGASRMGSGGEVPSRQPAWQWRSVAERAVCAWMEERMERNDSITGRGVDTSSSATWQR